MSVTTDHCDLCNQVKLSRPYKVTRGAFEYSRIYYMCPRCDAPGIYTIPPNEMPFEQIESD